MRVIVVKPTDTYYAEHGLAFTKRTYVVDGTLAPLEWRYQQVVDTYRRLGEPAFLARSDHRVIVYKTRTLGRPRLAFADWRAVDRHLVLTGLVLLPRRRGRIHTLWVNLGTRILPRPSAA